MRRRKHHHWRTYCQARGLRIVWLVWLDITSDRLRSVSWSSRGGTHLRGEKEEGEVFGEAGGLCKQGPRRQFSSFREIGYVEVEGARFGKAQRDDSVRC